MKLRIKLSEGASMPEYAREGDAGLDLVAVSVDVQPLYVEFNTGISLEIPPGYVGLLFPRSSISKTVLIQANAVGVIDSGYRGEVKVRFKTDGYLCEAILKSAKMDGEEASFDAIPSYDVGDKVAQLVIVPLPEVELEEVDELSESERGDGGFGHTGK